MDHGVYIHVPFCRSKCDYCAFYSVPAGERPDGADLIERYVQRIVREIGERAEEIGGLRADTLFIGGGTPSLLTAREVETLIAAVGAVMDLAGDAEITMEINSDDAKAPLLRSFVAAGVNRLVLGVQTLDKEGHAVLGRAPRPCGEDTLDAFFSTVGAALCADMIVGVPVPGGDPLSGMKRLTVYGPAHISAYLLSIEKDTPLAGRMKEDEALDALQRRAFGETASFLEGRGYLHYEISNYALPGMESRHNMKYWRFAPYVGLGAGAHSFTGAGRLINAMNVKEYLAAEKAVLDIDERRGLAPLVEYVMTGMRLLSGLDLDEMEARLGLGVPPSMEAALREQASRGLVLADTARGRRRVRLSPEGLLFADTVIYSLVEGAL